MRAVFHKPLKFKGQIYAPNKPPRPVSVPDSLKDDAYFKCHVKKGNISVLDVKMDVDGDPLADSKAADKAAAEAKAKASEQAAADAKAKSIADAKAKAGAAK